MELNRWEKKLLRHFVLNYLHWDIQHTLWDTDVDTPTHLTWTAHRDGKVLTMTIDKKTDKITASVKGV